MTTISYRKTLSLAAVFIIVSLALVVMDRRDALDPVREGLSSVVSPVASSFMAITRGPGFESELEKDLERVTAERDALMAENANLKAMLAEFETLKEEQRAEAQRPELDFVSANVLNFDPGGQEYVIIDKGSEDGIEVGMAVTDPDFYVGQVVEVTESTAKVLFIIDTSAQVGAQLVDSRADGIVVGKWQVGGRLLMQNVNRDAEVDEDDVVVTSGSVSTETRGVPPNIIIGTVFGGPQNETGRSNEVSYEVRPQADFGSLDTVWVVMPHDEQE